MAAPSIARLGHVGIHCKDLEKQKSFYRDVIGLQVTNEDEHMGMVFLSARPDEEDHELLLVGGREVDDVLLLAGLFRALVLRAGQEEDAGLPHFPVAPSLIRAAMWRAARAGLPGPWRYFPSSSRNGHSAALESQIPSSGPARPSQRSSLDRGQLPWPGVCPSGSREARPRR